MRTSRRYLLTFTIAAGQLIWSQAPATAPPQAAPPPPPPPPTQAAPAPAPAMVQPADIPAVKQAYNDPILHAMAEELKRSSQLGANGPQRPYFLQYMVEDQDSISVSASLGSVLNARRGRVRIPLVQVRIGNYELDNTNHIYSGISSGSRYAFDQLPLDGSAAVLQQNLWLATDHAFKSAVESMLVKQSILKNATQTEKIDDFWKAKPIVLIEDNKRDALDLEAWKTRAAKLSGIFRDYPEIYQSSVEFDGMASTSYHANTEGTAIRYPDHFNNLKVRAASIAPDGATVRDAWIAHSLRIANMPTDAELEKGIRAVAANVKALAAAPLGESYSGPVVFEPVAGAQLLGQMIGDNLRPVRKPLTEPGRTLPIPTSDFETRLGARVLPDFFDVTDDATAATHDGRPLLGFYRTDLEGVAPTPVKVIEKGVFKTYLHTRQPIKGFTASTGHARLMGGFGAYAPSISNLFIRASESKPLADLKKQLIAMIQQRNKPYGLLIRKLDYPTAASMGELRAIAAQTAQSSGGKLVPQPVLTYKIYPDGREELVRGLRFRGFTARSLRDILAATTETQTFELMNNAAPLAMLGNGGFFAPATVIAPGILIDDLELEPTQGATNKPPVVPPPTID